MDPADLKRQITERLEAQQFDAIGFTRPDSIGQAAGNLKRFLELKRHGTMNWLEDRQTWRGNPAELWPETRTVIMAAMNYGPRENPLALLDQPDKGSISVYARARDYHDVLKKRLKQVAGWLHRESGADVKVFVDTAPVMEKPLAQAAGIGWQGKHSNLVSEMYGSWLFLGSIFTTIEFPYDQPGRDRCGSCSACLDICPTDAFPAPYQLDARRCISYLTIEHKDHIPHEFRQAIGNRIYGCDDCLAVCPWNKFARVARESRLVSRDDLVSPDLMALASLDDTAFRKKFSGSPIKRIGRDRFVRNVLIAIGNSGKKSLSRAATGLLSDPSPVVRAMAVWACRQILDSDEFDALRSRFASGESDAGVSMEWQS